MSDTIEQILSDERLIVHFQPIISPNGRMLFGFESLVRGIGKDGSIIPPIKLFEMAKTSGATLALDRLARVLAIRAFEPLWKADNKLILFVNFEPKLIDNFEPGNYLFYGELKRLGIPYGNVVLEVKEDEITDTAKLKAFCDHYREAGFNIALDDFGVGQSSFDRIAIVRPDIIKIDRSLMTDIQHNQIHQEIVNAICKMCHNIGALPLAEGVETLDETVCSISQGAMLLQGFYLAKPSVNPLDNDLESKVGEINASYADVLESLESEEKRLHNMASQVESGFCSALAHTKSIQNWAQASKTLLDKHQSIEALYLINEQNKQVGPTLIKSKTRSLYEPTSDGYDYSLKAYYVRAKNSIDGKYLTRPYLSLASGSLCRTYSSRISVMDGEYILCVDFAI